MRQTGPAFAWPCQNLCFISKIGNDPKDEVGLTVDSHKDAIEDEDRGDRKQIKDGKVLLCHDSFKQVQRSWETPQPVSIQQTSSLGYLELKYSKYMNMNWKRSILKTFRGRKKWPKRLASTLIWVLWDDIQSREVSRDYQNTNLLLNFFLYFCLGSVCSG